MYIMGEVVDWLIFMWIVVLYVEYDYDFVEYLLNDNNFCSKLLYWCIDVDYNGWWMCMILC